MCKDARGWAQVLAQDGKLKHNIDTKDGENLFMSCDQANVTLKPWKAVPAW